MKIVSSLINDIKLCEGKYHAITFSSTKEQMKFRQLFENYFRNRKGNYESEYIYILDKKNKELKSGDLYFVNFDCNVVNLTEDRDVKKSLKEMLLYHLKNHPEFVEQYMLFNNHIDQFAHSIEFKTENLLIEFTPSNRTIKNFINSMDIHFEFNENEYVPNYELRNYLIKTLLNMNEKSKPVILFLSYPEADVGYEDFTEVINLIKQLNVTTIVLSAQKEFLCAANIDDMFLIEKYGTLYNIGGMKEELEAFNLYPESKVEKMSKLISYIDFTQDKVLLDPEVRRFLDSNKL